MSLRRLAAVAAVVVLAAACGKTENKIILPTPTPTPSPTLAPIATVATSSVSAVIGAQVSLDGTASHDPQGGTLLYTWEIVASPDGSDAVLAGADTATPNFVPDVVGTYQVKLVVTDTLGIESAPAFVVVTAATCGNAVPAIGALTATASSNPPVTGDLVTLGASSVADPNSACGTLVQPLRYEWSLFSQPAGSNAQLNSPSATSPTFVADVPGGVYVASLTVTDAIGNRSAPAFVQVTTSLCGASPPVVVPNLLGSAAPAVASGADLTALVLDLDNTASCPGFSDTFTYSWAVTSTPAGAHASLVAPTTLNPHLSVDQAGVYTVAMTATASNGQTGTGVLNIAVNACGSNPPVTTAFHLSQPVRMSSGGAGVLADSPGSAVPGNVNSSINWYSGFPISLSNDVSDLDQTPACGSLPPQPVSYAWKLLQVPAGSAASIAAPNGAAVGFTPDVDGTYVVQVTTTDSAGDSSTSTVTLQVVCGGSAPQIGAFQLTQLFDGLFLAPPNPLAIGEPISLGATTSDPDANATATCFVPEDSTPSYRWSLLSAPAGSRASIQNPTLFYSGFTPDALGAYLVQLTVTDPQGHSTTQVTSFDVECNAVAPSVVAVGSLPDWRATQSVALNGGQTLSQQRASNATLDFASLGTLVPFYPRTPVLLQANVVTQQSAPGCPVIPMSLSYAWSLASQPAGSVATLNNPSSQTPSFTPDLPGNYAFQLKLTDANTGLSSTTLLGVDTQGLAVVNVGLCGTNPPVAATSLLGPLPYPPTSTAEERIGKPVLLDASSSFALDALPYPAGCDLPRTLSYDWSLVSAPAGSAAQLDFPARTNPSFVPDLGGVYTLRLTVDDGAHASSKTLVVTADQATITVPGTPSDASYTATAIDTDGKPVVAWWDPVSRTVEAARCVSSCDATPVWQPMPRIDGNLGPIATGPDDESRPIAIAVGPGSVAGGNVYVAYYTGGGTAVTTMGRGWCGMAMALWNGSSWENNVLFGSPQNCDAGMTTGQSFGRFLSLQIDPTTGAPVLGWVFEDFSGNASTVYANVCDAGASQCTNPATFAGAPMGAFFIAGGSGLQKSGKYISIATRPNRIDAAFMVDGGPGARGLAFATCTAADCSNSPTSWAVTGVDSTQDVGRFASLAIVPPTAKNGLSVPRIDVAYRDATAKKAKIATCSDTGSCASNPGAWTLSTVADPDVSSDYGRDTTLFVDDQGLPRLAWFDDGASRLRVLSGDAGAAPAFAPLVTLSATGAPAGLSAAYSATAASGFVGFNTGGGLRVASGF